jgi:hypothetical protein
MEKFGIHSCWHDKDMHKDTGRIRKNVLNMVHCVVDYHSVSDALDTYNTIFKSRSTCSIDSSGSNKKLDPPPPPVQNPGYQIPEDRHAHCCSPISRTGL